MKRCVTALLVLVTVGMFATDVFGILIPFSYKRIAAAGKHCVGGYDGNFGTVGTYYAGDAAALNDWFATWEKSKLKNSFRMKYASQTVVLHPGPMLVPKHIHQKGDLSTDWLVTTWHRVRDQSGQSGSHIKIDVWLGRQIKLDELRIPANIAVESGGEIEDFVARRKNKGK